MGNEASIGTFEGASVALPQLKRCTRIEADGATVLILAAGFEERRNAAIRLSKCTGAPTAIVLDYKPYNERNDLPGLLDELNLRGFKTKEDTVLPYDRYEPTLFDTSLAKLLKVLSPRKVILDISAMSKLAIIICLDTLRELNTEVEVFYAEALHYRPSREEYGKAWKDNDCHRPSIQIYTGVHRVLRMPRLSSVAMQGQPTAAIAFTSFNEELIQILLNTVYPSRLLLVNGRPPRLRWRERATAWIHGQLRKEWGEYDNPVEGKLPKRVTSTRDYTETVDCILDLYWQLAADFRVLLAPTGSKMQTVGCAIARALHPDIHIEYPTPLGFMDPRWLQGCYDAAGVGDKTDIVGVDPYSKGIGPKWIVRFGQLANLIESLKAEDRAQRLGV